MHGNRKGLPLERGRVSVDHSKVAGMVPADRFVRTIELDGPLDASQRAGLLAIAERCPVDLTLVRGSDVQTRLAGEEDVMPSAALGEQT